MIAISFHDVANAIETSSRIYLDCKEISKLEAFQIACERFEQAKYVAYDLGISTLYLLNT